MRALLGVGVHYRYSEWSGVGGWVSREAVVPTRLGRGVEREVILMLSLYCTPSIFLPCFAYLQTRLQHPKYFGISTDC